MAFSCFAKSPQPGSSRRGSASPLAQDSNRKLPKLEPAVDYDNDFGDGNLDIGDVGIDKLVRVELEARRRAAIASGIDPDAPVPSPPVNPPEYDKDVVTQPLERRPKPHGWLETPDVSPAEGARTKEEIASVKFVPSEHAAQPHATPAPTPLAERTFARYPPGCGPFFGGPSWPTEAAAPGGFSHALRSAGFTANFCVIVATGALAPCASALIRAFFDVNAFFDVTSSFATNDSGDDDVRTPLNIPAPLAAWSLSSLVVCAGGWSYWRSQRTAIARWMRRVAAGVGIPERAPGDVVVSGVAFFVGLFAFAAACCVNVAAHQLVRSRYKASFVAGCVAAVVVRVEHERRTRSRRVFKRALTAFFDAEKSKEGLAALMGKVEAIDKSKFNFGSSAPSWARFQENELADWLNGFLARTWPFYNRSVCNLVRDIVEPLLEEHRPGIFSRLYFDTLDLGHEPIQVRSAEYVGTRSDAMGVSLELDVAWPGRAKIKLNAKSSVLGSIIIAVKDVEVYAKVRVTLQPLMPTLCPFGGLIITLTEKPAVEFDLDLPLGLEGTVTAIIEDFVEKLLSEILGEALVWPERIVIPIADEEEPLKIPNGETVTHQWYVDNVLTLRNTGLVCVTAKRAENVVGTDLMSKADSYVRMYIKSKGKGKTNTEVIDNNNDPTWNHTVYMLVDDMNERKLTVAVMDENSPLPDVVIGEKVIDLKSLNLTPNESEEIWIDFPETEKRNRSYKRGPMRLLLDVTYIPFDATAASMPLSPETMHRTRSATLAKLKGIGMLTCVLVKATGVKAADRGGTSDPYCKLSMPPGLEPGGKQNGKPIKHKSRVVDKTLNPEWNETFEFVGVKESGVLTVECYDRDVAMMGMGKSKDALGVIEVNVMEDVIKAATANEWGLTEVEREFALKGDQTITGTVTMKLIWQPFA